MYSLRYFSLCIASLAFVTASYIQSSAQQVKQPREVIEAYRVCNLFQQLLAEDLDFGRAFEATFTRNISRRREIAITEGEFSDADLKHVATATLVDAYKNRMQIFYLMLPLVSPSDAQEERLLFPPKIKTIFKREAPRAAKEFPAFAAQLKRDAADLRAHLDQLAAQYPFVAERVRQFKSDLSRKAYPPNNVVQPLTAYSRGNVLGLRDEYYQIENYAMVRERGQMRIIGIRFFTRLF